MQIPKTILLDSAIFTEKKILANRGIKVRFPVGSTWPLEYNPVAFAPDKVHVEFLP
jgi:hypothetical protein